MGYNLKRDGWLNSFTDVKNQSVRDDGVPWRGAREKRPEFFSMFFSALTDKDDILLDWQCGVGLFFTSLFFISLFVTFYFLWISFVAHSFPYPHLFAFCCSRKFHHCLPLHSTPYCGAWIEHWCLQVHPPPHSWARTHLSTGRPSTRLRFCSSSLKDGEAQFQFVVCVSSFLATNWFEFLSSLIAVLNMFSFFFSLYVQISKWEPHPRP